MHKNRQMENVWVIEAECLFVVSNAGQSHRRLVLYPDPPMLPLFVWAKPTQISLIACILFCRSFIPFTWVLFLCFYAFISGWKAANPWSRTKRFQTPVENLTEGFHISPSTQVVLNECMKTQRFNSQVPTNCFIGLTECVLMSSPIAQFLLSSLCSSFLFLLNNNHVSVTLKFNNLTRDSASSLFMYVHMWTHMRLEITLSGISNPFPPALFPKQKKGEAHNFLQMMEQGLHLTKKLTKTGIIKFTMKNGTRRKNVFSMTAILWFNFATGD